MQNRATSITICSSNDDPDVWILYENWKALLTLQRIFEMPYMKKFLAVLPEALEGEMDLRRVR